MKRLFSFATVLLLTFSAAPLLAQSPYRSTVPTINRLAQQAEVGNSDFGGNTNIPNPFDFGGVPEAPPTPTYADESAELEDLQDPTSLPTGIRHRRRNAVDAMVDYAVLSGVGQASHGVHWGYGIPTAPNHIANILVRQECVDGLWDSYPAMRAAECELMWRHLTATKHCGCGGGCNSGCQSCQAGCATGGCAHGPRNRYTASCDSCR